MSVLIVDYGMSNIGSIMRSVEECGGDAFVSGDPKELGNASRIVLPGVGSFADGMSNLHESGWVDAIREAVLDRGVPILGICLGMQLLAEKGCEGGDTAGLGLISGEVRLLEPVAAGERVPHVGWNEVYPEEGCTLFEGIPPGTDFYFVHSYHLDPRDPASASASTPYCGGFVSSVMETNVYGVQFHPEKSGRFGFRLLKNFLKTQEDRC